jgi:hypothetical protein
MYGDVAEGEAMAALDRGAWNRAEEGARVLAVALRAVPMALWEPVPALITGRALLGSGRALEAVGRFDDAARIARSVGAQGTLGLAGVYRVQAASLAGLRPGRMPANASSSPEAELAAVAAETVGVTAFRRGDPVGAADALDRAVELWQRFGSSAWLARALALRAEALRASGDRARAAASMGRARAVAAEIGMPKPDRAALEQPLGDAG